MTSFLYVFYHLIRDKNGSRSAHTDVRDKYADIYLNILLLLILYQNLENNCIILINFILLKWKYPPNSNFCSKKFLKVQSTSNCYFCFNYTCLICTYKCWGTHVLWRLGNSLRERALCHVGPGN